MPRRTKIQRYDDILKFPNVTVLEHFQNDDFAGIRGRWHTLFGNNHPLVLELACGKGEYSMGLSRTHPEKNYIGMDIKGDRIWKGARQAMQNEMHQIHFLRARIDHICNYFAEEEISEIWIPFPDPYPSRSKKRKRLTHPLFLQRYARITKPASRIHIKTDSEPFFDFTLRVIRELELPVAEICEDVYRLSPLPDYLKIQTYYERKHLEAGKKIKYICFYLNRSNLSPSQEFLKTLD